jgi:hypothetical protein
MGILAALSNSASADAFRPGLRFFCYCAPGNGFEPRQATIIFNEDVPDSDNRQADSVFVRTGENRYSLISLGVEDALAGKTVASFPDKASCLALFFGHEDDLCDGDVRETPVVSDPNSPFYNENN